MQSNTLKDCSFANNDQINILKNKNKSVKKNHYANESSKNPWLRN